MAETKDGAIRRLTASTRRAITMRPSSQSAQQILQNIRNNLGGLGVSRPVPAAPTGLGSDPLGYVNIPGAVTSASGMGRRPTADQYGMLGRTLEQQPPSISLPGAEMRSSALSDPRYGDPYRERTEGVTDQFGSGFRADFASTDLEDAMAFLSDQIDRALADREAAIAAGQMEVAAQFDEEIAKLNDAKAKLIAGRANINARYGAQRDTLRAQADQMAAQAIGETGTDVRAEVAEVGEFFEKGQKNVGEFLSLIGSGNPALAKQLGGEIRQFQDLAEERLRNDLEGQAKVLQAAGMVAKKVGEVAVAQGLEDSEGARVRVESDLVGKINQVADHVRELQEQKVEALAAVAEQIGDYDDSWLDDYEGVWNTVATEFLATQGYDREQIAEMMNEFDDLYFGLPTDKRNHAGVMEWMRQNLAVNNASMIASMMKVDSLDDLLKVLDPVTDMPLFNERDVQTLWAIARNGNAGNVEFLSDAAQRFLQARGGIGELDLLTEDDYQELVSLVEFRNEFRDGGYDDFVRDQRAIIAGRGSYSAIDPRGMSKSDMALVRSGSGQAGYVHPSAASSLEQMVEAARRDGVVLNWSDTYRDYEYQMRAYQNFLRTHENMNGEWVDNIADPSKSLHPRGLAVDFTMNAGVHDWLRKNASRFGWGGISNEIHHWEYRGGGRTPEPDHSEHGHDRDPVDAGPSSGETGRPL